MSAVSESQEGIPIASVEQVTGIARATLRIWERRYGFPQPGRDPRGERSYPDEQVRKLRLIAELMAQGHRPGRLVAMAPAQLASLADTPADRGDAADKGPSIIDPVLAALRQHDAAAVLELLEHEVGERGVASFIVDRMADLNVKVGLAWSRGELQVFEEHLYTECVQQVLRPALAASGVADAEGPRVLLATFPDESHGLGLLMAHGLLALQGCACTSLGVKVPVAQIVAASRAFGADVVGLSFTASMNPAHVLRGLEQLRGELAPEVQVWAGGRSPVLARHRITGIRAFSQIAEVPAAVAQWRAERRNAA